MPWKTYTQKNPKERHKNVQIFYIFTKRSTPNLTTREVEQQMMGYGKGSLPDQQFLTGSHPAASRRARLSLLE